MEREVDQINVIPLVDIMLVLLVIVLTTATFITTGQIPVNLAKASTSADRHDRPIVVTVTAEGRSSWTTVRSTRNNWRSCWRRIPGVPRYWSVPTR